MAKRLLILGLVLAALVAGQTLWHVILGDEAKYDWYVYSMAGSDDNSGISQGLAFATLAKLETVLADGDSVCVVRGSHFREQLTITEDNVTLEACGLGADPIFDASAEIAAESWSKMDGQTNVYEASLTLDNPSASDSYIATWEDGVRLTLVADVPTCDSTPGSYYRSSVSTSPFTLYVHPTESADPGSSGAVYEYNKRDAGIWAKDAESVTIRGVATRRNYHANGSLVAGINARIYDSEANEGTKHNLYVRVGSLVEDTSATQATFGTTPGSTTLMVAYDDDPAGGNVTFRRCSVSNTGAVIMSGIYTHATVGNNWGAVLYEDCAALRCGFGGNNFETITYSGCLTTTDTATMGGYGVGAGGLVYITDSSASGVGKPLNPSAGAHVIIRNWTGVGPSALDSFGLYSIQNNVTYDVDGAVVSGYESAVRTNAGKTGNVFKIRNLVASGLTYYNYHINDASIDLDSDYNTFQDGKPMRWVGVNYNPGTDWACFSGQDANSTPAPGACE